MAFTYPGSIDTPWKKVQYILRLKEYLRLLHNYAGYWYRNGLTQDQYDNGIDSGDLSGEPGTQFVLTAQLKTAYPYRQNISKAAFDNFINTEWEPRHSTVSLAINDDVKKLKDNNLYDSILDLNF